MKITGRVIFISLIILITNITIAAPITGTPREAFRRARFTEWFLDGLPSAPHKTYIIADMNCADSQKLNQMLRPYFKSGQLAVRWVLVPSDCPTPFQANATVLQGENPIKTMGVLAELQQALTSEPHDIKISDETRAELRGNNLYKRKFKITTLPLFVYRDSKYYYHIFEGIPTTKQLEGMMQSMAFLDRFMFTAHFAQTYGLCNTTIEMHHPGDAHRRGLHCHFRKLMKFMSKND